MSNALFIAHYFVQSVSLDADNTMTHKEIRTFQTQYYKNNDKFITDNLYEFHPKDKKCHRTSIFAVKENCLFNCFSVHSLFAIQY